MEVRTDDFLINVARGNIEGASLVHKFGSNNEVRNVMEPITLDAVYQTPSTPTSLELVSASSLDTDGGVGAHTITVTGIGSDWTEQTEIVTMNGTTAVPLTNQFLRVYRVRILTSGTYATQSTGSHAGDITLQELGGGNVWAGIALARDNFPLGSSEIGCYTVPKGYEAILLDRRFYLEAGSARVTAALFKRSDCDIITSPYSPMTIQDIYRDIGERDVKVDGFGHSEKFVGPCDIGFMAN